jgi:hypothetical protein
MTTFTTTTCRLPKRVKSCEFLHVIRHPRAHLSTPRHTAFRVRMTDKNWDCSPYFSARHTGAHHIQTRNTNDHSKQYQSQQKHARGGTIWARCTVASTQRNFNNGGHRHRRQQRTSPPAQQLTHRRAHDAHHVTTHNAPRCRTPCNAHLTPRKTPRRQSFAKEMASASGCGWCVEHAASPLRRVAASPSSCAAVCCVDVVVLRVSLPPLLTVSVAGTASSVLVCDAAYAATARRRIDSSSVRVECVLLL